MSEHGVAIEHNFETAHRIPPLEGKCQSLHGHSWLTRITVTASRLDDVGCVVEFGALKTALRAWIDTHLDHGAMLGTTDPLITPLVETGSKVFVFGTTGGEHGLAFDLPWPTVEAVAVLLRRVTDITLRGLQSPAWVSHVLVRETSTNYAEWTE